jgi:hypothetical protein
VISVGASFTFVTVIVTMDVNDRPPGSVDVTDTDSELVASKSITFATRIVLVAVSRYTVPDAVDARLYVKPDDDSKSDVDRVPMTVPTALFSTTVDGDSEIEVGASFTFVTDTVNDLVNVRPPTSVTRMLNVYVLGPPSKSRVTPDATVSTFVPPLTVNGAAVTTAYVNASPEFGSTAPSVATVSDAGEFSGMLGPAYAALNVMSVGARFGSLTTPDSVDTLCCPPAADATAFSVISEYTASPTALTDVENGAVVSVVSSDDDSASSRKKLTRTAAGPLTYVAVSVNVVTLSITNGGSTAGEIDKVILGPVLSMRTILLD